MPEPARTLDPAERRSLAAAAGVTALGPVVMVSGCLRPTDTEDEDKANAFALNQVTAAVSLTQAPSLSGITTFRVVGAVPDLRRHAGDQVEIVGTILEEMPTGAASVTLEAKSVRKLADACKP